MSEMRGTVGIVGATGFIGRETAVRAEAAGWRVVGFSRSPRSTGGAVAEWRVWGDGPDLSGLDAVVNLAGEPIDRRWTDAVWARVRESRIGVTQALARAMAGRGPAVWVNGSAVGVYGDRGEEPLSEDAAPGSGVLAELCREWEVAADAAPAGVRVVKLRTGIVLGRGGAAWEKMRRAFRAGLGGRFGDGRQWMPWIHVADLAGAIVHALDAGGLHGPVNGSAPGPERNADFTRILAAKLHRPAVFHAPGWALRLGLGEFAGALLASQKVVPRALGESGFRFRFPTLDAALDDLL